MAFVTDYDYLDMVKPIFPSMVTLTAIIQRSHQRQMSGTLSELAANLLKSIRLIRNGQLIFHILTTGHIKNVHKCI